MIHLCQELAPLCNLHPTDNVLHCEKVWLGLGAVQWSCHQRRRGRKRGQDDALISERCSSLGTGDGGISTESRSCWEGYWWVPPPTRKVENLERCCKSWIGRWRSLKMLDSKLKGNWKPQKKGALPGTLRVGPEIGGQEPRVSGLPVKKPESRVQFAQESRSLSWDSFEATCCSLDCAVLTVTSCVCAHLCYFKGMLLKILVLRKSFPCGTLAFLYIPILPYFLSPMFSLKVFSSFLWQKTAFYGTVYHSLQPAEIPRWKSLYMEKIIRY